MVQKTDWKGTRVDEGSPIRRLRLDDNSLVWWQRRWKEVDWGSGRRN